MNWPHAEQLKLSDPRAQRMMRDGLLVAFAKDHAVLAQTFAADTVSQHVVQVTFGRAQVGDQLPFTQTCFCQVDGLVAGLMLEAECGSVPEMRDDRMQDEGPVTGLRFLPVFRRGRETVPARAPWPAGVYRVVIEGNFILGEREIEVPDPLDPAKRIKVHPALDAEHFAPGLSRDTGDPPPPLLRRRCPTGDGLEGGRFVSWFELV